MTAASSKTEMSSKNDRKRKYSLVCIGKNYGMLSNF